MKEKEISRLCFARKLHSTHHNGQWIQRPRSVSRRAVGCHWLPEMCHPVVCCQLFLIWNVERTHVMDFLQINLLLREKNQKTPALTSSVLGDPETFEKETEREREKKRQKEGGRKKERESKVRKCSVLTKDERFSANLARGVCTSPFPFLLEFIKMSLREWKTSSRLTRDYTGDAPCTTYLSWLTERS